MHMALTRESSCRGTVGHVRHGPRRHAFRYPVWMLYVDIDRLGPQRPAWRRLLASVDSGHLLSGSVVRRRLADAGIESTGVRIFALTQPGAFGVSFNPVNFYFCTAGDALVAVLADVTNTPWGEQHCYVLRVEPPACGDEYRFAFAKAFHVSPFLPMQGVYRMRVTMANERLRIAMRFDGGDRPFFACLALRTRPLAAREALLGALRRPAQNAMTLARIYWQATRLFAKRTPFFVHPGHAARGTLPKGGTADGH